LAAAPDSLQTLLVWDLLGSLGGSISEPKASTISRSIIDEWSLGKIIESSLLKVGYDRSQVYFADLMIKILTAQRFWYKNAKSKNNAELLSQLLQDEQVRAYINVNRHNDILWFNKERFESLLWWLMTSAMITSGASYENTTSAHVEEMIIAFDAIKTLQKAADKSEFKLANLLDLLS